MTEAIQDLRDVMWRAAGSAPPDPEVVRSVTAAVDRACRTYQSRLPRGMVGLRREVRFAATNYFGGSAVYAVDPRAEDLALDRHEHHWWSIGVSYLDYVIDVLQRWRENPDRQDLILCPYDQWRRDEDAAHHESRRGQDL